VADPGCIKGKAVIIASDSAPHSDEASTRKSIGETISGLKDAAAKAKNTTVRDAMTALADDYSQLLAGMDTGNIPNDLTARVTDHAQAIDKLCTIGS
jgi:hypothetical protein